MSKPLVTFPDPERLIRDHLATLIPQFLSPRPTVTIGVPDDYTGTAPHLEVALDGVPSADWPVLQRCTIRIVARASSTTLAKSTAMQAIALLLAGGWPAGISSAQFLTGVLADRDPATNIELAAFTVRVNLRSTLA